MGEVGVHLEHTAVLTGQGVLKAADIGRTQPQFARAVDHPHTLVGRPQLIGDGPRAVG